MKITIESTPTITSIDGVLVRHWKGTTLSGIACNIFVHRVMVDRTADQSQFARELDEQLTPTEVWRKVDHRKDFDAGML